MANRNIDIPPLFKYSYRTYKKYASFVIGVMATYFVLGIVPQIYLFLYPVEDPTIERQIVSIIALMIQLFIGLGFTKIMLYLVDGRPVQINDLVNNGRIFFHYVVGYFMFILAVGVGLMLLVLPGIYLAIRLQFYIYYIIEEGDPSFIALQKSWKATENLVIDLFLLGLIILFLNFMGSLFLGIGVILTYPITTMATSIVFLGLRDEAERIPASKFYLDE